MRIAVTGANGTLGRAVTARAVRRGHEVIAITRPGSGQSHRMHGVVARSADVATGARLREALDGAEVVINAVSSLQEDEDEHARAVLVDGTRHLLDAASDAGAVHYVATSIVGIDDVPFAYCLVKREEERVVEAERRVGWSIQRATQFHEVVDAMFSKTARYGALVAPFASKMQPIDAGDVADVLVTAAESGPARRLPDIGGPEVRTIHQLARQWIFATRRLRVILPAPLPGGVGARLAAGALCAPNRAVGKKTFREWLDEKYRR